MYIITTSPNSIGAYRIQDWPLAITPNGYAVLPHTLYEQTLALQCFVHLSIDAGLVTGIADNLDARAAWGATQGSKPPNQPTPDECLAALNEENQILTSAIDTLMTVILPGIMGV
jgi:hypothetical protein